MSAVTEITKTTTSQMASALELGYNTLSANQKIEFTKYVRFILPLDGYVFWIKADQLTAPYPTGTQAVTSAPNSVIVEGSLHYTSTQTQKTDQTTGIQDVILTTNTEIVNFNELQPTEAYFGSYADFKFSFSAHGDYYEQSNLWHYRGQAIYPYMGTQIIDDLSTFDTSAVIVSNSLPIWLAMNSFAPVFPSFLVPENIVPPYIVANIIPHETKMLQPIPWIRKDGTIWQLMRDKVELIIYGMRNEEALNYLQYIINKSLDTDSFGILESGFSLQDGKNIQSEINAIAEQKRIELDISYNQNAVYDTALKFILHALPMPVILNPFPVKTHPVI